MDTKQIIENFYQGLSEKSDKWKEHVAESVTFSDASGTLHAEGKDAFTQAFTLFLQGVASLEVKQMIIDKDRACSVISYTYVNQKREKMQQEDAEVWEIKDGQIASLKIYFDISEFRSFMRG